jgi:predicted metal-dependent HD superfamily phosphohydrolase
MCGVNSISAPFQVGKPKRDALRRQWEELAAPFMPDAALRADALAQLFALYSETHRAYHNLSHIHAMLFYAEDWKQRGRWRDYAGAAFAIWYHDSIYQTRNSDNEERSAAFALSSLKALAVPAETAARAEKMILATKTHSAEGLDEDGKLFLDLDLAILGSASEVYRAYAQAIRAEYSWVPGFLYRRGRRKILNGFLERERLFFTDEIAREREKQARANIAEELKELG